MALPFNLGFLAFVEVSISTLKSLSVTKSQLVPTLSRVIPYLEVCSNQEYLVHRLYGALFLFVCLRRGFRMLKLMKTLFVTSVDRSQISVSEASNGSKPFRKFEEIGP